MTDARQHIIQTRLLETFAPLECQFEDESAFHAGHPGAAAGGGHYRLRLISANFEGLNRLSRHRLVYDCLRDLMENDIHALSIIALAPSEVSK